MSPSRATRLIEPLAMRASLPLPLGASRWRCCVARAYATVARPATATRQSPVTKTTTSTPAAKATAKPATTATRAKTLASSTKATKSTIITTSPPKKPTATASTAATTAKPAVASKAPAVSKPIPRSSSANTIPKPTTVTKPPPKTPTPKPSIKYAAAKPTTKAPSPIVGSKKPPVTAQAPVTATAESAAAIREAQLREGRLARLDREADRAKKAEVEEAYKERYKGATRRWVSAMIALPIFLVTSYYLFDRLALGHPVKPLPREKLEAELPK